MTCGDRACVSTHLLFAALGFGPIVGLLLIAAAVASGNPFLVGFSAGLTGGTIVPAFQVWRDVRAHGLHNDRGIYS